MPILDLIIRYFRLQQHIEHELRGVTPPISPMEAIMVHWVGERTIPHKDIWTTFGSHGSYAVTKLEKLGLISVTVDAHDKRRRVVHLTAKALPVREVMRRLDRRMR